MNPEFEVSVTGIATAGFKLSLLLNAAACQLAQSGIEIYSITKGISLFSSRLKQTKQVFYGTSLNFSCEVQNRIWEIALQGHMIFTEIEDMLDKLKSTNEHKRLRGLSLQHRIKYCFRKQRVTYFLSHLESLKLSLMVTFQVLQLAELMSKTSPSPPISNDDIIQEKAEAQNMIIVRYWSLRRLGRLWEFVEKEDQELKADPTNQLINSNFFSSPSAVPCGTGLGKLLIIPLGDRETEMSATEQSPKEMLQWSGRAVSQLLSIWVPTVNQPTLWKGKNEVKPRVSFTGDDVQGSAKDWRKSHPQDARHDPAQLRRRDSKYQAYVKPDLEPDRSRHSRADSYDDDGISQYSDDSDVSGPAGANVGDNRNASSFRESASANPSRHNDRRQHSTNQKVSSPSSTHNTAARQIPIQSGSSQPSQRYGDPAKQASNPTRPNPAPTTHTIPNNHSPRGPHNQRQQGRSHSMRAPQSNSEQSSASSSRPRPRDENKHQRPRGRTATRGLPAVGAIAGFMEALEAFSVS